MKLAQIIDWKFLESFPPDYDNLIGCDQKPRLTSVSGRIPPCPNPEHYLKCSKLPFEAFASSHYSLSNLSPQPKIQGPKHWIKAPNLWGNIPNLLFNLLGLQIRV